jgi:N-acetylneuraminic acid mutarotase
MGDTANGKLYVGGGSDGSYYTSRIWEYDSHNNNWKHKSGLPVTSGYSGERMGGFCIAVNNKLYFGLGSSYYSSYSGCEFYTIEYDPVADTFSRKADFIGPSRYFGVAFNLNGKIYAGLGNKILGAGSLGYLKDFYQYDPSTNVWTRKADFPGLERWGASSFVINGKAYVTNGLGVESSGYDSTYEYDPSTDTWTVKTAAPVSNVALYEGFSIDTLGYYLAANKFWSYSPATNRWDSLPDFPGSNRDAAVAFSVGHSAYVAMGEYGSILNDIWQYRPDCPANIINELSLSSKSNTFCGSTTIDSIKADSIAYSATTYQWLISNDSSTFLPIATSDSIRLRKRTFNQTTYLKRIVTLTAGCFDTSLAIGIHVNPVTKPKIDSLTNTQLCLGDTAVLACIDSFTKSWYLNDTLLADTGEIFKTVRGGTYKVVTVQVGKCTDTSAAIKISYLPRPIPVVIQVGSSLETGKYLLYQWYDAATNPIAGATSRIFSPSAKGFYRVKVIDTTGCSGWSSYTSYIPTGISNLSSPEDHIQIFPNPATQSLTLFPLIPGGNIAIINTLGQTVQSSTINVEKEILDISLLPAGSYLIRITNQRNTILAHFVKQ